MGNLESVKVNTGQLDGSCSRELDLSRSLTYEQYQKHSKEDDPQALHEIPEDLVNIYSTSFYEKLKLSCHCISAIPYELSTYLPHLVHLDLSYNRVSCLPESFGYLFHLQTLLINNNNLYELPDSFCYLARLEKADLSHNQLTHLPRNIGYISNLKSLNVGYNELETLPASLGEAKNLTLILAIFNKCKNPPQQICNQGSDMILAYFRKNSPAKPENKTASVNKFPRVRGDVLLSAHSNPDTARVQYVQSQTNTNATSRTKTPLRPPVGGTTLPPDELVDKIVGCLYGAAIGDAIGLCTEFMLPDECRFHYEDQDLNYNLIIMDRHRSKWQKGDWTDTFDQTVLLLETVLSWAGVVDELEFARVLLTWCKHGFPELGDAVGRGVRGTLAKVICEPSFTSDPHGSARKVWESFESPSNGAIMRTSVLGVTHFYDLAETSSNAIRICKTTHHDPRCVASCVALSSMVALILQPFSGVFGLPIYFTLVEESNQNGHYNLSDKISLEELIDKTKERSESFLTEAHHQKDYNHYFKCQTWDDLELCEPRMIDYTFKTLAAALVGLRSMKDYKTAISELVMQGGHATCNASVTGALLGCKYGYSELPKDWIEGLLPKQVMWLNRKLNSLLDMMALP